jgi:ribosomal protein S18 acetylase RimI-like enzyme
LYAELARFVAAHNGDPAHHIGYLGDEANDVIAELTDLDEDAAFGTARDRSGRLVGLLGVEWDTGIGRAWLLGPWTALDPTDAETGSDSDNGSDLMDRLYATVDREIPDGVSEREIFCAVTNAAVVAFAGRHGFGPPRQQAILTFPRSRLADLPPVTLPALTSRYVDQFMALHDSAFPGTHTPAAGLLDKGEPIWMAVDGDTLLGYVTLKLRPEFDDAQIDYLAVAEPARGRGVGATLLAAALHLAFADARITSMELVTSNPVARRLYERTGFTLSHDMRSFRADRRPARVDSGTRSAAP